ncbi:GNAT family N-acetyltransferase [Conyzicola nivalis]|uniref:GNAT family acetyltransferase n=1 Tax=Conyzicola nivalis TaxID=1477021 RepID=A0A916WI21_9MICO|nr:GNAT family N-acetyltransferase [Conyzicola nivalis]GGB01811.1 GNAT family acetyltransferase [Conyzicola nivalis]
MTRTERLSIDRLSVVDFDAMWSIHADPLTNAFNPAGPLIARSDAQRQFGDWLTHWHEHGFGYWTVRDDEGVVGFSGIRFSTWNDRTVLNLFYRYTPRAWGKGYATEVARAAVELWRDEHSAHPLIAYTTPGNVGSQRTALSAGLERRPDLDRVTGAELGDDVVFALGWS